MIHLLHVHSSRSPDLVEPERLETYPDLPVEEYYDRFGNHRGRICAPPGPVRLFSEAVIRDSGEFDAYAPDAAQLDVSEIPTPVLEFLLPARYCEIDSKLMHFAWRTFLQAKSGWERVQAICDFVHGHLKFDYQQARSDRTALEAFREGVGVCRDFTHLAITLCRCLNIPARYATGYLKGLWYAFDARHNRRRIGQVLIGLGRDAADVPITMAFGQQSLDVFHVFTEEIVAFTAVSDPLIVKAA